jgi:hypothetical protein
VAFWHVAIFALYFTWDMVTKVAMYPKPVDVGWFRGWSKLDSESRIEQKQIIKRAWPTAVCLMLSIVLWRLFTAFDVEHEHLLAADLVLWSVVLLFRALKGVIPGPKQTEANISYDARFAFLETSIVDSWAISVARIPSLLSALRSRRSSITSFRRTGRR